MKLIAAVAQTATVMFDTAATVAKAETLMAEAAARGAQVLVFPEAFIGGYPKGADFHIFIGARTPEGRQDFLKYYEAAVTLDGPEIAQLAQAAGAHKLYVCVGIIEREGGTLYCTAVYLGPEGTVLGHHRKLMPTALERLVWGYGDGSTLQAVETPFGKLGAVICWENYMPALRMAMYQQRVALYCAPTADDRDSWISTMQHIAMEGRCFVLSSCQHLRRAQFPSASMHNRLPDDPETLLMRGGSCIISPAGKVLAGPVYGEDVLLTAEIDLDDIPRAQMDFDPVGHYARPDVFQLAVNTAAQRAVQLEPGASTAPHRP
ncbi:MULTISPECIES: carbon-nitrogen hydrolase family protein [unclassified Simplicispira]|uniref:carbon-nitrogen hydrolase family protein n=1 Tax=unclassified Simplicispira TaxID=2630407 RepID=UPI000D5C5770|nr:MULTISPECIES: carbon-nitrogen hydrolase family protein [unclassified Simplicispira]PVY57103.1 nitrilase [Simplicispira sp. 125]REG18048.1 nitrilase [Simplicispira sp. 110]